MDNKGFEMQDDPANGSAKTTKNGEVVLSTSNLQNGYSNGKVSPVHEDDPELAAARDKHQKEQEKRDREPLRFIRWISDRTCLWFGLTLAAQIFFLVLTAILVVAGYDILPITFDRVPLDIRDSKYYLRGLAWDARNEDRNDIIERAASDEAVQELQTIQYDRVGLIFEIPGGNVFTKKNLEDIQKTEQDFMELSDMDKYCLRPEGEQTCTRPDSIIQFFDGTHQQRYPQLYDPEFNDIPTIIYEANNLNQFKNVMKRLLAKDAVITRTEAKSSITQSILQFGNPLEGFANSTDREDDQESKFDDFFRDKVMPKGDDYFSDGVGDMDFSYGSGYIIGLWVTRQVILDLALAVGSFAFIAVFMTIQTGSIWIMGWTIFSIITGFCGANLVYRIVLDFRYVGVFHVLSVFIVLGIGADDVFVFVDTWKETAHHPYKSLAHRMSECYRKAALAMLFTSVTTAIAFFVSGSSPFLGIYSFGIFSGVLIIVNYCSVITFLPCVVLMYHKNFEKFKCCCCCRKPNWTGDPHTPSKPGENRKNPIVRFFAGPYFKFVTNSIARWFILLFFIVLLGVFIYFASTLKVNEEQIKFVDENVPIGKYIADVDKFQSSEEAFAKVYIVFGLREQDLDNCHHTDTECLGLTVWDTKFSLKTVDEQNGFKAFCDEILGYTNETDWVKKLKIKMSDSPNPKPEVQCFANDLQEWFQSQQTAISQSYPISQQVATAIMNSKPDIYDVSDLPDGFDSWVETGTSFWLYDGFNGTIGDQFREYDPLIGEIAVQGKTVTKDIGVPPNTFEYYYGTNMTYLAIVINTTIDPGTLGFPTGIPIMEDWEEFMDEKRSSLPSSLRGAFQCTPEEAAGFNLWHWLLVQEKLVDSALVGIVIGVCTAWPILIIATHNLITGTYATIVIVLIVTMVIGFIPMAGWKLGLLESVNLVLLVGLSVDYVVHLAEAYSRSSRSDRKGRVQDMLTEVGISVLSGAITTLGASIFLLAAKILFFLQFGLFMFCTIGFSILFALGLFVTTMAMIGPQGETGDIYALFRKCCKKNSQE